MCATQGDEVRVPCSRCTTERRAWMPYSRRGKAWLPMLVALTALLAFAPQASSTEYPDESAPVGACVSGDYEHDPCSVDEPKPADGETCGDDHARVAMGDGEERSDDGC